MKKFLLTFVSIALILGLVASFGSRPLYAQADKDGAGSNLGKVGSGGNLGKEGSGGNTVTPVFYLQNPLDAKFNTVGGVINGFLGIFTYLVILFAVIMIIYVGLRFVLAQGNTTELTKRKDQLLWLLVGVGIVIGARILIGAVINTLDATGVVQPGVINNAQNAINGR